MKRMDVGVITAIVGGLVSIITGGIGYYSGKSKDELTDRELLSKDEQTFRAELREELKANKEEIARLSQEVIILRQENMELVTENRLLNVKVEHLVEQLSRYSVDGTRMDRRWGDEESS